MESRPSAPTLAKIAALCYPRRMIQSDRSQIRMRTGIVASIITVSMAAFHVGCDQSVKSNVEPAHETPAVQGTAVQGAIPQDATDSADQTAATPPVAPELPLPEDWSGTGILAARKEVPRGAPAWTATEAEVVDVEGKRYLRVSGVVSNVKNRSLARSAAQNRARAQLAKWLATDRLIGATNVDGWQSPSGASASLMHIEVPLTWVPGQPLPAPEPPAHGGPAPVEEEL